MHIRPGDTATSSDGMFTVMIQTELRIPPGTLTIKTNKKDISVRILSGKARAAGNWKKEPGGPIIIDE